MTPRVVLVLALALEDLIVRARAAPRAALATTTMTLVRPAVQRVERYVHIELLTQFPSLKYFTLTF